MWQSIRRYGYHHLLSALLQSLLLSLAAGLVFRYGASLPMWALVAVSLLVGIPGLLSIQRAWVRFLWDKRLQSARLVVEKNPQDHNALYELGVLQATRGQHEEARETFDAALALAPTHAPSMVGHGHVAAASGDLQQALLFFERAVRQDSGLFSAHFGLGTVLMTREQYARAITSFEAALELDPDDGPARAEIARCHLAMGEIERARERMEQANELGYHDADLERDIRDLL